MFARSIVVVATMLLGTACAGSMNRHSATVPIVAASEQSSASEYRVTRRRTELAVSGAERIYNCEHNTLLTGHGIASYADGSLLVLRYQTSADGSVNLTVRKVDALGAVSWTRRFDGLAISDAPTFELRIGRNGERLDEEQRLATR